MELGARTVFLLLGYGSLLAARGDEASQYHCDFSDMDIDNMVEAIADRLPRKYSPPDSQLGEVIHGLTIGSIVFDNLDKLTPYGAPLPYCRGGSRFVQVDLATPNRVLEATVPWKYCGGKEGEALAQAKVKVTVIFKVAEKNGNNSTKLVYHSGPAFATVKTEFLHLRGAGDILGGVFYAIRMFLPEVPKEFWNELFINKLHHLLKEIA